MMDDDDHYPETSFRRRVAYLEKNPQVGCAVCTTIALYDLRTGISAVKKSVQPQPKVALFRKPSSL